MVLFPDSFLKDLAIVLQPDMMLVQRKIKMSTSRTTNFNKPPSDFLYNKGFIWVCNKFSPWSCKAKVTRQCSVPNHRFHVLLVSDFFPKSGCYNNLGDNLRTRNIFYNVKIDDEENQEVLHIHSNQKVNLYFVSKCLLVP